MSPDKNPCCFWLCLRHKQFTVVCEMSQLTMVEIFKSIITLVPTLENLVCCPYLSSLFSIPLFSSHASFPYLTLVNTCSYFTASAWLWLHCNVTVQLFCCTCFLLCALCHFLKLLTLRAAHFSISLMHKDTVPDHCLLVSLRDLKGIFWQIFVSRFCKLLLKPC